MCIQKSPSPRARHALRVRADQRVAAAVLVERSDVAVGEVRLAQRQLTEETWIGWPSAKAPMPRAAHQRRPSAGAEATPTTSSPSTSRAMSVAQIGMPLTKLDVPSMGSMIQRARAAGGADQALLLAQDGVVGAGDRQPGPDGGLGPAVGHGHLGPVGLVLDLEVGGAEVGQGDGVGPVGQVEGQLQLAGQLQLGPVELGRHLRPAGRARWPRCPRRPGRGRPGCGPAWRWG